MAVMRLVIEVDSEVYPELHAGLSAISRPDAREERLRQLAASGLVWESVRMRGTAAPAQRAPSAAAAQVPAQGSGQVPAQVPAQVPVLQDVVDLGKWPAVPDEPPEPPALETPVRRTGARSARLKRMNDRGLFKNG